MQLLTLLYLELLLKITFIKSEKKHIYKKKKNPPSQASPVFTAGVISQLHVSTGAISLTAGSAMQMEYVVHFAVCCHGY